MGHFCLLLTVSAKIAIQNIVKETMLVQSNASLKAINFDTLHYVDNVMSIHELIHGIL